MQTSQETVNLLKRMGLKGFQCGHKNEIVFLSLCPSSVTSRSNSELLLKNQNEHLVASLTFLAMQVNTNV